MKIRSLFVPVLAGLASVLFLTGCGNQDEITRYTVPRTTPAAAQHDRSSAAGRQDRILAAAVPQGEQTWFFKLTGPSDAVAHQAEAFAQFLRSIKFTEGGDARPTWTLPAGWQQQPGSQMRFATIAMEAGGQPLELTVIPLPTTGDDEQEYLAANVNRWRDQLGLPPVSGDEMFSGGNGGAVKQFEVGGTTITLANLVGQLQSSAMGGAPFAGGAPSRGPAPGTGPAPRTGAASGGSRPAALTYDAPQGWSEGPAGGLRHAAFTVEDGGRSIEITVITLPPAGGDLLANVNRWREELELGSTTADELRQEVEPIDIDQTKGHFVELVGPEDASPRKATLGAIAQHGGQAWFFTLKGDAELAQREKLNFRSFVESVKFSKADGAGNGK